MRAAPELERKEGFESFLERELTKELLRFTTAGSVDDGKSTLIGRLLHDSKAVYEDQLAAVKKSRINRAAGPIDFALLTDGLRAEREQGITIDVAYRYFSTSKRKFIIADTPGHEQYTRNMATGASTADLSIILVDATKGLLPQTRRHAYVSSLLGIRKVVVAINKMDLAGYREDVYLRLQESFHEFAKQLRFSDVYCVPVSALEGDNVAGPSERMPWYTGQTLLELLETVPIEPEAEMRELRFPVQYVCRPDAGFRGFSGRLASGTLRPGDEVLALPSRKTTRVKAIVTYDGELPEAIRSQSVTVTLTDEIDLSRGDMLVTPGGLPQVRNRFAAMVVWLHAEPLRREKIYIAKHAGRQIKLAATNISFRVNVNTLAEEEAAQLEMNEIALVEFEVTTALFFDTYDRNRQTGSFILIDPISNATMGAGMIQGTWHKDTALPAIETSGVPAGRGKRVSVEDRERRYGHRAGLVMLERDGWIADLLERELFDRGFEVRAVSGLGEAEAGVAIRELLASGLVVICYENALSPESREELRLLAGSGWFDLTVKGPGRGEEEIITESLRCAESLRVFHFNGRKGRD